MQTKAHINITIDPSNLQWVDMFRGQEPRSTFINKVIANFRVKSKAVFDWELEEEKAEEDIQNGRVQKFSDAEKALKWLKK